jgi:ribose 5-phosphate isomerase B
MRIAIASDHAGVQYKASIIEFLSKQGHQVKNFGTDTEASCDYADFAHPLSSAVEKGEFEYGILICGTSNGMCMTANKHQGIRAGIAWTEEIAGIIRAHNNANILGIPSRFVSINVALAMVSKFLSTAFEGGRHQTRIEKIPC